MRIGVDVRCLIEGRRTGVEEYTLGVLRAMVAAAPEDRFVLFANSRAPMRLPVFSSSNVEMRVFSVPNKLLNLSLKVARYPKLDVLARGVEVFFVPVFRLAPLSFKCPLVLTVHDLSFVRHPDFFSRKRRLWHALMEPERLALSARRLIAVSAATARDAQVLYGVSKDRISVIPSGIPAAMRPLPDNDPRLLAARQRYGLPERFILFLGTLEPRKNLDGLLEAYRVVREAGLPHALVLAGVRGWIPDAFFARIGEHPYAADIKLTGFVEDEDKPAVYRLAELFVYPSFYEGFGFPPLEALACGTPVVTSFNSAIPEIVGGFGTALVNPYDPEELAAVIIERLREHLGVAPEVSANTREMYSWERAGSETLRVLRDAAMGKERHENRH